MALSEWNKFTSKIFKEGRSKHGKAYSFRRALQDASKRKHEMSKAGGSGVAENAELVGGKKTRGKKSRKSKTKKRRATRKKD